MSVLEEFYGDEPKSETERLRAEIATLKSQLADIQRQWDMYGGDEGITAAFQERDDLRRALEYATKPDNFEHCKQDCDGRMDCADCVIERVKAQEDQK